MSQQLEQLGKLAKKLKLTDKGKHTFLDMNIMEVQSDADHDEGFAYDECELDYDLCIYTEERTLLIMFYRGKMVMSVGNQCHIFMTDAKVVEEDEELVLIILCNKVEVAKIWL